MRLLVNSVVVLALVAGICQAGDPPVSVAQAKAALALASAKRMRESRNKAELTEKDKTHDGHCLESLAEAEALAAAKKMPLIKWVGMQCKDSPAIRDSLPDAIHCHLATYKGDGTPAVYFPGVDGKEYLFSKDVMNDGTGLIIRRVSGLPTVPKWK